jgi:hypothetical protein
MYRHINKGAWTFSIQDHGWQVFVTQQMKTEAGFHKLSLLAIQNSLQLQENKPNVSLGKEESHLRNKRSKFYSSFSVFSPLQQGYK